MSKAKYSNLEFMYTIDCLGCWELKENLELFKSWRDDDEIFEDLEDIIEAVIRNIEKLMRFPQIKKPYKAGKAEYLEKFKKA